MKAILAIKKGMQTVFDSEHRALPSTVVTAGPCVVTGLRTPEKNGYRAVQIGFGNKKKAGKSLSGLVKKLGLKTNPKIFREVEAEEEDNLQIGQEIKAADMFKEGDTISVTGISKGKGFAGVVKRWHFKGGPRTHGQSDRERAPGSSGSTTTPGRVYKGKRMAGRMGGEKITIKNLKILKIDPEKNLLWLGGAVPGVSGGSLILTKVK